MKKIFLYFLIGLILVQSLNAAEIYEFESFSESPEQAVFLYERDGIKFSEKNGEHVILLEKVKEDSIDLSFFIYKENRGILTLRLGNYVNVDVDRDFKDDFKVSLKDFSFDLKKASIRVEALPGFYEETNTNGDISSTLKNEPETTESSILNQLPNQMIGITLTILIIVIGLVIFYLFKKFNH